tara:strand:- start:371 stop:2350 length:1980 start_codon:yes stop_codon:yes gene_type:complete
MPEILTNNFNQDINKLFIADAKANDDYYMFVSSIGGIEPVDSATSQNEFLEKTLFAKKIQNDDINFMIKYYPWQRGVVYSEYDDNIDLDGLKFYAVVGPNDNDTDDYRIYKCLNNNEGVGSESPPTYDAANVNQIYETADGYVWKYMYRLTTLQFEGYNALGYIPIDPTATIEPAEVYGGGISEIQVTNAIVNNGYEEKNGLIKRSLGRVGSPFTHGDVGLEIDPREQDWNETDNYYAGQYLYATNPSSSVTNLFVIKSYELQTGSGIAKVVVGGELADPRRGVIENATAAEPVAITSTDHNLVNGQPITFRNVQGMIELNLNELSSDTVAATTFYVSVIDADTFSLKSDALLVTDLDGSSFTAYTSGGEWEALTDWEVSTSVVNANIKIFPRVVIQGDGVGAVAVPEIDSGAINKVILLNKGSGYNNAIASVVDPIIDFNPGGTESADVRALIDPIIEPRGGHGYNLLDEFRCKHFSMYAYITAEDNTKIGDKNTYGCIGIVRTPQFKSMEGVDTWRSGQANTAPEPDIFDNRIAIVTDDYARLNANSTITQVNVNNDIIFSAQVHEIDETSNTVYLAEYVGPNRNNALVGNGDTSFNPNLAITSNTGQRITINNPIADNVIYSDYKQRTGEVYFMEDFFPLARNDLSREEFKFVLEF